MSSSKSHSVWCFKCSLVICSACVFFSSCVTLTCTRENTKVEHFSLIHTPAAHVRWGCSIKAEFNKMITISQYWNHHYLSQLLIRLWNLHWPKFFKKKLFCLMVDFFELHLVKKELTEDTLTAHITALRDGQTPNTWRNSNCIASYTNSFGWYDQGYILNLQRMHVKTDRHTPIIFAHTHAHTQRNKQKPPPTHWGISVVVIVCCWVNSISYSHE